MILSCRLGMRLTMRCISGQSTIDLYKVMGLEKQATSKDIKAAYYRLSKIYHPDSTSSTNGSPEKFHDLTEAYEVLGNSDKRREYDHSRIKHTQRSSTKYNATNHNRRPPTWSSERPRPTTAGNLDVDYENFLIFQKDWRKRAKQRSAHQSHAPPEFGFGNIPFESVYKTNNIENFTDKMKRWDDEISQAKTKYPSPDIRKLQRETEESHSETTRSYLKLGIGALLICIVGMTLGGYYKNIKHANFVQEKPWHQKPPKSQS